MEARLVSEFLTKQLALWGVKRIYGVTGDGILPWLDVLGKQEEIQFVLCRHESAAAMMASAEAKLTGQPAVCIASEGPGTVNLLNGLADAHIDRVPVIAITAQVETSKLGGDYKQYIQQEKLFSPISHFSATVASQEAIGMMLQKAFATAMQRKGVAHLGICKDIFSKLTTAALVETQPHSPAYPRAERMELEQATELIQQAKKPIFLAGKGARHSAPAIKQLAEALGAGLLLSLGAKGMIAEYHPQTLGGLGEGGSKAGLQALHEADLLVVLGASWFPPSYIPLGIPILQVDENPEAFHHFPTLVPVLAHLGEALPFWLQRFELHQPDPAWKERVEQLHRLFVLETEQIVNQSPEERVKPETLLSHLSQYTAKNAVITLDTGEHTLWFNRAFRATGQCPLFSGKWRTMGYALPAAIAAKLVSPEKEVVAIVGDGGFLMNVGELITLMELGLSVKVIVVNNSMLGLEEVKMREAGLTPFGTKLKNPDFVKLADSFGWKALRIERVEQLDDTLRQAFADEEAVLVEVVCTHPTLTNLKQEFIFQAQA